MTDEQVKKGLECCSDENRAFCSGSDGSEMCPYWKRFEEQICPCEWCRGVIAKDALALINRLEDENTGLTGALEAYKTDKTNLERTIDELRDDMSINGLVIDDDGNETYSVFERIEQLEYELYCAEAKAQAKTAKDILSRMAEVVTQDNQPLKRYTWFKELCEKYGVEVDE